MELIDRSMRGGLGRDECVGGWLKCTFLMVVESGSSGFCAVKAEIGWCCIPHE